MVPKGGALKLELISELQRWNYSGTRRDTIYVVFSSWRQGYDFISIISARRAFAVVLNAFLGAFLSVITAFMNSLKQSGGVCGRLG